MAKLNWEALGGDPAPGDPGAFESLGRSFSDTAENAGSGHSRLERFYSSVDETIWSGESADAFLSKMGELAPKLKSSMTPTQRLPRG